MLDQPIIAKNIDGMVNKKGTTKSYVDLEFKIGSKNFKEQFYVTRFGKQRIILVFPWLRKHNPKINWKTGKIDVNYKNWILEMV